MLERRRSECVLCCEDSGVGRECEWFDVEWDRVQHRAQKRMNAICQIGGLEYQLKGRIIEDFKSARTTEEDVKSRGEER